MNKVKYIHILYHDEMKFSTSIVKIVCEEKTVFDKSEHAFVTPHKRVYEELKSYGNVYLDVSGANLINKYAPLCSWIIYHGHIEPLYGAKIKKKNYRKLILRYWGGTIGYTLIKGQFLKNIARRLVNFVYINKIRNIAAIGIANEVDELAVRAELKNMPIYEMPYSDGKGIDIITNIISEDHEKENKICVLLGHSGREADNHIEIIEKLDKYGDKICIYIPLSYGDTSYRARVEKYVNKKDCNNIILIKDFLPYSEYVRFLKKMDVAIFDGKKSYALGNISILLFLKKKLFLNRYGIIKAAFDAQHIPCVSVDEIDNMDFNSFVEEIEYPENMRNDLLPYNRERALGAWTKLINDFN